MIRLVIALGIMALAGTPLQAAAQSPAAKGELRVRIGTDTAGLDPARIYGLESDLIAVQIYSGLVDYDIKTGKVVADLAERWQTPDNRVWTFLLRRGVKFHKGFGELTADDVRFSFERVRDPETKSPYAGEFANVDRIEAVDAHTLRITLKKPQAGFIHQVSNLRQGHIVSRKAVEKFGADFARNPVGTGPFVFEKWTPKTEVVLVANRDYYAGAPRLQRVILPVIIENATADVALQNGELDVAIQLTDPPVLDRLRRDGRFRIIERRDLYTTHLVLNTEEKPFNDVKVRRAIFHAIDRDAIAQLLFPGVGNIKALHSLTPNFVEFTRDVPTYDHNPARARQLLAEAGYPNGFDTEIVGLNLQPVDKYAILVAGDLQKIGVRAKLEILERPVFNQRRIQGNVRILASTGIPAGLNPDAVLWRLFHTSSLPPKGLNTARVKDMDALLESAQTEVDPARRTAVYHQIQRKIAEDVRYIPLIMVPTFAPAWSHVKNFDIAVTNAVSFYPV